MSWAAYAVSAIFCIVTVVYFYIKKKYSYFEEHGVPHLKPHFPFGNIQGVTTKYHMSEVLMNLYRDLKDKGSIVGFYNMVQPMYLVTDIELVKIITVKNFSSFVNRGFFVNEEDEPLTAHLVSIEDDRWRFMRHKLSPVFTSGKLKSMYSTIDKLGINLVKTLEKKSGKAVEAKDISTRFTLDVVSSTAFGMDSNTLNYEHPELIEIFREISGEKAPSAIYFFFLFAFPDLAKFLKFKLFGKHVEDFFTNVVGKNIKYREDHNERRSDFMDMLIQLKNKGSIDGEFSTETRKLTLNECLAQSFLFFFAGSDTSSTTISFALTELAFHPDIQEKLRKEILESTKDTKGKFSYEMLHEMTYLDQVVNEALRMYTPGFANLRKASEDFKVPDTEITIKKGSSIWIPTLAFHFDEKYWKNPLKFDPDRFTPEEVAKRPHMSFFPFGEGPRNCIGMRFGLLNVKFAVATIIKNFKVTPDARMKYPFELNPRSTQVEPKGGFWLKFEKI